MIQRSRTLAGPFFTLAGAMHFIAARPYRARLPLRAVFIAWVLGAAQEKEAGA